MSGCRKAFGGLILAVALALSAPSAHAETTATPEGSLVALESPGGCVAETGLGGKCTTGVGTDVIVDTVVSPDGNNVYVFGRETLGAYERHADGSLTQINCISLTGTFGKCADGYGLEASSTNSFVSGMLLMSGDGHNVYVFNEAADKILTFTREPDGSLSQMPAPAGCVADDAFGGECRAVPLLNATWDIDLSPDGRHMYAASKVNGAVVILERSQQTGALGQPMAPERRCISPTQPGCKPVSSVRIQEPVSVDVSPNGNFVYIASDGQDPTARDVLAAFRRDVATGELAPLGGPTGCVSASGNGGECMSSPLGHGLADVTVSPNGRVIYLGTAGRIAVDPETGLLGQDFPRSDVAEGSVYGGGVWSGSTSSFSADGRFVYSLGHAFSVSDTGELTAVLSGDPYELPSSSLERLGTSALSPDGRNVYVVSRSENYGESTLNVYNVAPRPVGVAATMRRKNGSAVLSLDVPDAGTLTLAPTKFLKGTSLSTDAAQTVTVTLAPTARAMKRLRRHGRLDVMANLTFVSRTGQSTSTDTTVVLKRKKKKHHGH